MSRLSMCVLVAAAIAAGAGLARSAWAADIRGVVSFAGPVNSQRKLPVTIDQYVCGKEKPAEDLVVGPDRGVRNVVVWLRNPPPGGKSEPVKVPMDQKGCVFIPHVVLVPAGGTTEFLNSDRLLHNLHSVSKDNPPFNRTQPPGRTIPVTFAKPEIIRVNCDLHAWMQSWVVVADHPFYAVTDEAGAFRLAGVAPGKYTLEIWHETLGQTSRDVTVDAQDASIAIELRARP